MHLTTIPALALVINVRASTVGLSPSKVWIGTTRMTVYNEQETGFRGPVPRDARLVALILASMGVADVQPQVLLQLLEFAHRYAYDVLSDALVYSDHANSRQGGSNLTLDDLNLAIQSRVNYSFTKPPEKDVRIPILPAIPTDLLASSSITFLVAT
jgi:hypothetical protein